VTFRGYVIRGSVCDDFLQTGPSLLLLLRFRAAEKKSDE
jgi:hypothetical protein